MFLLACLVSLAAAQAGSCTTVTDCRAAAVAAMTRGDMETFHDLAWRAVQKGKPNDPDLMYLLARAMALSGRPGDAEVMLERLADAGVKTDAATNDDFRVVRTLKEWPDLAAKIAGLSVGAPAGSSSPANRPALETSAPAATPAPAKPPASATAAPKNTAATSPPAPAVTPASEKPAPPAALASSETTERASDEEDLVPFSPPFDPSGLAHDAVSRRFVLADRAGGRLVVIDDRSHHQATLVSAAPGGFYPNVAGFTIDTRRGDLWLVSTSGDGDGAVSSLHKLQLVSGRGLGTIAAAPGAPSAFAAVAVTPEGAVYVVDQAGKRLLRLRPGGRTLEPVVALETTGPASLIAADDRTLFVASNRGIARIDLESANVAAVRASGSGTVTLAGWRSGALFGAERTALGIALVELRLDAAGTRVVQREVLVPVIGATATGMSGRGLYYLAAPGVIRHLTLPR